MLNIKNDWKYFQENVVDNVWKMYKSVYERLGLEYDDFVGISYEILTREMPKHNNEKSGAVTYGINVLKVRMGDYIRNNYKTNKTKANYCALSLNSPAGDNTDTELEEMLVDPASLYRPENNVLKIKRFYKTLSNRQKDVLFLKTIGLEPEEIQIVLDITPEEYSGNIKKIKSPRRISKLKNEVIENGKNSRYM